MPLATLSTIQPQSVLQASYTIITGKPFPGAEPHVEDQIEWNHVTSKNGVDIYKGVDPKVPGLFVFKGTGIIPHDMQDVFNCLYGGQVAKLIDPLLIECDVFEQLDDDTQVLHSRYSVGWPITDREFYFIETKKTIQRGKEEGGDCVMFAHKSVDIPDKIEAPGTIRAIIHQAGWLLEQVPNQPSSTKATFLGQVDLRGWLPKMILNFINQEEALVVAKIGDFLTKRFQDYQQVISRDDYKIVKLQYERI